MYVLCFVVLSLSGHCRQLALLLSALLSAHHRHSAVCLFLSITLANQWLTNTWLKKAGNLFINTVLNKECWIFWNDLHHIKHLKLKLKSFCFWQGQIKCMKSPKPAISSFFSFISALPAAACMWHYTTLVFVAPTTWCWLSCCLFWPRQCLKKKLKARRVHFSGEITHM